MEVESTGQWPYGHQKWLETSLRAKKSTSSILENQARFEPWLLNINRKSQAIIVVCCYWPCSSVSPSLRKWPKWLSTWACRSAYIRARSLITFRVSRRRREMYCGHVRLCVCVSVCPHAYTLLKIKQEAQLSLRDRATRACQLKSGKVLHKCRRLVFEKL